MAAAVTRVTADAVSARATQGLPLAASARLRPLVPLLPLPLPLLLLLLLMLLVLLVLLATPPAHAADSSRIEQVTVYPGLAAVERSARVAAGARELVLDCLSPSFDMGTLRVEPDAGVRVGPVSASTRPRADVPECSTSPLDGRIRTLEDRLAALDAESGGHDLVLGYLHAVAPPANAASAPAPRGTPLPPTADGLQATLNAIRRAGQQSLAEQNRLAREREAIERELKPLRSERDRLGRQSGDVRQLRVAVAATSAGTLRLRYQVPGPTWAPAYSATLDTEGRTVDIDRLAQVSQRSGEDWAGVVLRLSTGSPRAATAGPQPRRWEIAPQPAQVERSAPAAAMALAAPAPMLLQRKRDSGDASGDAPLDFAVQVSQGEFATEFAVPGTVDVGSGAQRVSLSLGSVRLPVAVKVQTTPQADASAWLVAEMAAPPGVWPDGPMQLLRGTQAVGQSVWRTGQRDTVTLAFGRDELVRVQVIPVSPRSAATGFITSKTERRIGRAYAVENRHRGPIQLEVLEATPVSTDDKITVTRSFEPAVVPGNWQDQPGVVAWSQLLQPGQTARFGAEYVISFPKDLVVIERK